MNMKIRLLVLLMAVFAASGFAQEKTKKQIKQEQKIEKQKQIEALLNSKTFVFNATRALPQGGKSINLTSSYDVKFSPNLVESNLPYYGRAYSGVGYGGDAGMKFEGKPEEFTVTKGKKNYSIDAVVKGNNDTYRLSLTVSFEGSGSLSITSNNRSFISYNGDITAPEKKEEKKQ
jgi:hypothetical protein